MSEFLDALRNSAPVTAHDIGYVLNKEDLWNQSMANAKAVYQDWKQEWKRRRSIDRDHKLTVIVSDTQTPWIDRGAFYCILHYIHVNQPEQIIQIGDHFDLASLSRFKKRVRPNRRTYLDDELYGHFGGLMTLQMLRLAAPEADFYLIEGNHEARWQAYAEDYATELWPISPNLPEELRLSELDITWVGPYGAGIWVGKPGGLWATHSELARKWSSFSAKANVLEKYGHSVIHGHTHRLGAFYHTNVGHDGKRRTIAGYEVGTLADLDLTPRSSSLVDWQHGFATVYTSYTSPRFHVDLIAINDGATITGGRRYGHKP